MLLLIVSLWKQSFGSNNITIIIEHQLVNNKSVESTIAFIPDSPLELLPEARNIMQVQTLD